MLVSAHAGSKLERMRGARLRYLAALTAPLFGCGETTYDLYEQVDPGFHTSSGGSIVSATGGGSSQLDPTGGNSGIGGDGTTEPPPQCPASRDSSLTLVRLVATGPDLCVNQGPATVFIDSPGYETTLGPCVENASQYWTVKGLSDGSWELRNEGSAMNLDVNYSYSADGTPVVLFTPHRLDNQRFYILPGATDSFLLAPDNAPWQCVEARDDTLEIWPCDAENPSQNFKQISCLDEE